ncbi:Hsp20/alpha crystallin family protein [Fodinibius salsisoli]|uniref:Hsp20/alpha crystallin family protein n=1 Tax=Fodinibius salsisoli TaxID=2820877 RepID=A0ABT3PIV9_9BACT|nr:Hsp20/alpha crystallin family protein [Fodinibius salsisoli]MCW9705857.1 Hsp20/alpha crystallin family protein [Fodinibius salsisoli]
MKAVERYSGLTPMETIRREMDRFFDDMTPFSRKPGDGRKLALWAPETDMSETDDAYSITVDLPGVPKEDVEVSFQDKRLVISGERKSEEEKKDEDYIRKERYVGKFVRSFTLPSAVKDDKIKASFKDGVLTVNVPKAETSKPKTVAID